MDAGYPRRGRGRRISRAAAHLLALALALIAAPSLAHAQEEEWCDADASFNRLRLGWCGRPLASQFVGVWPVGVNESVVVQIQAPLPPGGAYLYLVPARCVTPNHFPRQTLVHRSSSPTLTWRPAPGVHGCALEVRILAPRCIGDGCPEPTSVAETFDRIAGGMPSGPALALTIWSFLTTGPVAWITAIVVGAFFAAWLFGAVRDLAAETERAEIRRDDGSQEERWNQDDDRDDDDERSPA